MIKFVKFNRDKHYLCFGAGLAELGLAACKYKKKGPSRYYMYASALKNVPTTM